MPHPPFDFATMEGNFRTLLDYPFEQSPSRPNMHRVSFNTVSDESLHFIDDLNNNFGYKFTYGRSPSLGRVIMADTGEIDFGSYLYPKNSAFVHALGQISTGQHTKEEASLALTEYALMDKLYQETGADKKFGTWSFGFNQADFIMWRHSQTKEESLALDAMRHVFYRHQQAAGKYSNSWETKMLFENNQQHIGLKLRANKDMAGILQGTADNIRDILQISVHEQPENLDSSLKDYLKHLKF